MEIKMRVFFLRLFVIAYCFICSLSSFAQEITNLTKEGHEVTCVAFSPDARYLASGGGDNNIVLWDMASKSVASVYEGHEDFILALAFSNDAKLLASGDRKGAIQIWSTEKGSSEVTLNGHEASVTSLCFSPNNKYLVSGGADNLVIIWDVASKTKIKEIKNHTKEVSCVSVSPDGKYLATASFDGTVKVWDMSNWTITKNINPKSKDVRYVSFSPDSKSIACAFNDKTVKVYDIESNTTLLVLRGHKNAVYDVKFSPDGKYLASGSLDNKVKIWNAETGENLHTFDKFYNFVSLAFSPDGRYIAVAELTPNIKLIDVGYLKISPHMYITKGGGIVMKDESKIQMMAAAQPKEVQTLPAPEIAIIQPNLKKGETLTQKEKLLTIKGKVTSKAGLTILLINGYETDVMPDGNFSREVPIPFLESTVKIKAIDRANKITEADLAVQRPLNADEPATNVKVGRHGTDYALIIATNDYLNFNKLSNPVFDGTTIKSELEANYGFKVELVTNPTRTEIYGKLREYGKRQFSDDDQLFIFIAGHGEFDPVFSEGYIVAKDSKKDDEIKETYISHSNLRTIIGNIPCKHILLTMDVCFGGTFDPFVATGRGGEMSLKHWEKIQKRWAEKPVSYRNSPLNYSLAQYDEAERIRFIEKKMQYRTRKYITSGGKEYVPDGRPGQHSPFARKVIESLRSFGGDDKILTFAELYGNLETVVPSPKSGEFGNNQPGSDFLFIAK